MNNKLFSLFWLILPVVIILTYPFFRNSYEALKIFSTALTLYVLFFSIVVHEVSHGLAAKLCGDPTAANKGRLTLNPFPHVSVVGSILVPLALYFFQSPAVLGWAKPVPFNPINLKENPRDQVVVSLAGPVSNFMLAYFCLNLYVVAGTAYNFLNPGFPLQHGLNIFEPMPLAGDVFLPGLWFALFQILAGGILVNIALGVFNLIPFPPLDGSWILKAALPLKLNMLFTKIQPYGFFLLLVAIYLDLLSVLFYPIITLAGFSTLILDFCL
jgi:Zn-dependent protease